MVILWSTERKIGLASIQQSFTGCEAYTFVDTRLLQTQQKVLRGRRKSKICWRQELWLIILVILKYLREYKESKERDSRNEVAAELGV